MARFVTAGAIDPKLCTYVPLGKSNSDQILVQSGSWFGHQGAKTINKKCYNSGTNSSIIQIFIIGISNKDTLHNTQVFD
jgi:hypothetical protein